MRVLVIDPVATQEWVEKDAEYLRGIAAPGTELSVVALPRGPASIETFYDVAYAAPEVLHIVHDQAEGFDAIMINCFADPAVDAARELTDRVVLGPAETSMALALHLGDRFSVISTFANTAPWVRQQAVKLGVERRLASAIGIEVPVLELSREPERTVEELVRAAGLAVERDGAEVIILGCTGMATLAQAVRARLPVPLIEPAAATLKTAELLVSLGLRHHRGGRYLIPNPDKLRGY